MATRRTLRLVDETARQEPIEMAETINATRFTTTSNLYQLAIEVSAITRRHRERLLVKSPPVATVRLGDIRDGVRAITALHGGQNIFTVRSDGQISVHHGVSGECTHTIEDRVPFPLISLDKSFTYKKVERPSPLLRLGLSFIPIAGRVLAGDIGTLNTDSIALVDFDTESERIEEIDTASKILDCLSSKDLPGFFLQASDASDEEVISLTARLFENASKSISLEAFNKLDESQKSELEEIMTSSRCSIETLRTQFQARCCEGDVDVAGNSNHGTISISDVAQLENDIMGSISEDVRIWQIPNLAQLRLMSLSQKPNQTQLRFMSLSQTFSPVASLGAGYFVVGMSFGAVRLAKWDGKHSTFISQQGASGMHSNEIRAVAVHENRFVTASTDNAAVWDWNAETATIRFLANLKIPTSEKLVRSVSVSKSFIVVGYTDNWICVFDASSFDFQRFIEVADKGDRVRDIELVGNNQRCVSVTARGKVTVHDVSNGELVWKWKAGRNLSCCTVLSGGRIAIGSDNGNYSLILTPCPEIARQITPVLSQPVDISVSGSRPPLQSALDIVKSGNANAALECRKLITADNCKASLAE